MIHRWFARGLAGAGLVATSAMALAQVAVDQEYVPSPADSYMSTTSCCLGDRPKWSVQSFTAGLTGQLVAVDLGIWRTFTGQQDLSLQVHEISNLTIGRNLGQVVIPIPSLPLVGSWPGGTIPAGVAPLQAHVDLSALGLQLTAGTTYALAVSHGDLSAVGQAPQGWWYSSNPNLGIDRYLGGQASLRWDESLEEGDVMDAAIFQGPMDLGFRTYVSAVPDVPSTQMAAFGLLLLVGRAYRQQRQLHRTGSSA